jgi:hypothetical protein
VKQVGLGNNSVHCRSSVRQGKCDAYLYSILADGRAGFEADTAKIVTGYLYIDYDISCIW